MVLVTYADHIFMLGVGRNQPCVIFAFHYPGILKDFRYMKDSINMPICTI